MDVNEVIEEAAEEAVEEAAEDAGLDPTPAAGGQGVTLEQIEVVEAMHDMADAAAEEAGAEAAETAVAITQGILAEQLAGYVTVEQATQIAAEAAAAAAAAAVASSAAVEAQQAAPGPVEAEPDTSPDPRANHWWYRPRGKKGN